MIPLRDDVPSSRFPAATLTIIALNVLVFLHELKLGPHLQDLMLTYAVIPARYTLPEVAQLSSFHEQIFAIFSSMFLHGGWIHLIGNMWTLWIFGDNVEDRLGRVRYVMLYLASGVAAALLHIYTNAGSPVPTIGASGAIAGVMGAYFRFYPFARVETLIPPFIFGPTFVLPAVLFLGWWFLLQFFNGALSLGARGSSFSGVAWWAHVGGFLFGLSVCLLVRRRRNGG
ncbi:MAG TPA: rhomboid family intramembrane serine protease [Candidatus Binatia bacterium]|jgi:membrane associated rhomboid family serine protease|nr:rhomboid family intramembrane serine protease [Candidatus Binatia bacterium]